MSLPPYALLFQMECTAYGRGLTHLLGKPAFAFGLRRRRVRVLTHPAHLVSLFRQLRPGKSSNMAAGNWDLLKRLLFTHYNPDPAQNGFHARAESKTDSDVDMTVAVPDARESERLFGVPLARHGLQPVYVKVVNRSASPLRLHFRSVDPHYFPPLEAAARCHFSIMKRLSAFGAMAWMFVPLFFPVLFLAPLKLWSARRANRKIDALFQSMAFHRRPVATGEGSEGFVFVAFDAGTKLVRIRMMAIEASPPGASSPDNEIVPDTHDVTDRWSGDAVQESFVDVTFSIAVPGINADYLHRKLDDLLPAGQSQECDVSALSQKLREVATVTCNHCGQGSGDPINLVVIGSFEVLLNAFAGRWDETEVISLATCWKTAKSFLLGSEYRYSPVSSLYLFNRSQDLALQQIRQSISERLHLRLWLAPLTMKGNPVWIGQVSRDIGVRFTTQVWNLTTHRIDPDVDEARDYVLEDLLDAKCVLAAGYVDASAPSTVSAPRRNLTGDPYYSDGKRVVILLGPHPTIPKFIAWS